MFYNMYTSEKNYSVNNKDRFRELLEGLNVITYEFDLTEHRFSYVSKMAEAILGYPKEKWFEKGFWSKHIHPDDLEWAMEFSKYHISICQNHEFEYRFIAANNKIKWFKDIVSISYENGLPKSLYGVMLDMTERIALEKELLESKEKFETLIKHQTEMIARWKPDGTFTFVNDVFCNYFEKSKHDLLGKKYIPQVPIEDLERYSKFIQKIDSFNPIGYFTHRVIDSSGNIRWLKWSHTAIFDSNNNISEFLSVGSDITSQKKAELALKDSEQQLLAIFENAPIGMAITDIARGFLKVNRSFVDILGYSKKELLAITVDDILITENKFSFDDILEKICSCNETHMQYELNFKHKSGKIVTVDLRLNVLRNNIGKPTQLIIQIVDITKRIEADKKLKQTQARLAVVLNNLPNVVIYEFGSDVNFISENIYNITGYTVQEFNVNKNLFSSLMLKEDTKKYELKVIEWKKNGANGVLSNEIRIRNKNGDIVWIEDHMFEIKPENGLPYFAGIMIDITKQKNFQLQIKEAETKLYTILLNFPNIVVYQQGLNKNFISDNITEMIGYSPKQILNQKYFFGNIMHPDDLPHVKEKLSVWRNNSQEGILNLEFRLRNKNGKYIWVEDHMFKVIISEDEIYYSGILIDITDRKLSEQKMSQSLKEKEFLLKEIHHRVKNNLQVISSLLKLQANYNRNDSSYNILIDSQNRIRSMALVHQKLYQSKNLNEINFNEYLKQLTEGLINIYKIKNNISIIIKESNACLSIDYAIPCGMIINELVSNSLKYAFPKNREGHIIIDFTQNDNYFHLNIKDNGNGFPDNFDFNNIQTLGLKLVNTLVKQIDGKMEMINKNGVEFKINFIKN